MLEFLFCDRYISTGLDLVVFCLLLRRIDDITETWILVARWRLSTRIISIDNKLGLWHSFFLHTIVSGSCSESVVTITLSLQEHYY